MQFENLGLTPALLSRITQLGFKEATTVQEKSIPHILDGKDVLAGAQTGTGKTAAYGLPIIQRLIKSPKPLTDKLVRSLVLVPTRELAQQVLENLSSYAHELDVKVLAVYGGTSMKVQTEKLQGGVDILVATPGRLLDHLFTKNIQLNETEVLVLDEADRMLDMGFMPDIQRILRRLNDARQTLFFSATFANNVKKVAYRILTQPVEVQVTPNNSTADTVKQMVYPVDKKRKSELLAYLIGSRNWQQVLVFTKTREGSDALVKELKLDGIKAASINGDKSQGARQKALDDFKTGKVRALIATDVAARGLDIHQLEQVVNFDMPYKAEDYIHRIGRTGRAGCEGFAVSLMSRDEEYLLNAIERLLDKRLPQEWLAGFEPSLEEEVSEDKPRKRKSRGSEKRKLKAKLKIHHGRGKAKK
ncbi:ATP-dependent RNA helicase rhlE [Vibrio nigripulchritudo SOn1]|uniref:DEAD-box ATP-dependent RNA helicase RhpA n=1 Tax=Vibrio nigripulchritudo SOn1 TaxID=1238450 RepID=A0AAV2VNR7_9VIBR|nr:DEAD/DEAH box helicase [Vibrio nigripulchritudo]CCO46071.1 ATP-dependent RNA helicase rhlE [Vibrio nigripulchritudo SOn1]